MWDVKADPERLLLDVIACFIWTMWDVKEKGFTVFYYKDNTRFIWTMWDVKEELKKLKSFLSDLFYLNYVGCKAIYNKKSSRHTSNCFIWTMWDVKCGQMWQSISCLSCFIWTMWDVKIPEYHKYDLVYACFIWTMWDVKSNFMICSKLKILFYLNYVGCKVYFRATALSSSERVLSELCGM